MGDQANVASLGCFCRAMVEEYPHPEEDGLISFPVLMGFDYNCQPGGAATQLETSSVCARARITTSASRPCSHPSQANTQAADS